MLLLNSTAGTDRSVDLRCKETEILSGSVCTKCVQVYLVDQAKRAPRFLHQAIIRIAQHDTIPTQNRSVICKKDGGESPHHTHDNASRNACRFTVGSHKLGCSIVSIIMAYVLAKGLRNRKIVGIFLHFKWPKRPTWPACLLATSVYAYLAQGSIGPCYPAS